MIIACKLRETHPLIICMDILKLILKCDELNTMLRGHVDCLRAFLGRCTGSRMRARILMMLRLWPEPLLCRQLLSNSNGRAIRYGARFELVARRGKQCNGTCIKRNAAKYRIGSLCRVTRCVISTRAHKTEMMAL